MLLLLLLSLMACTSSTSKLDSPVESATDSPTDSVPESQPDTGDTGRPSYTHYMSVTAGTMTLSGGAGMACAGEAHLNYTATDGVLAGFCNCIPESEADTLSGGFEATVVEGSVSGAWEATNEAGQSATINFTGALDETTFHADLAGAADWMSFVGTVDGTAAQ